MNKSSPQKRGVGLPHWQGAWWWIIPTLIGAIVAWSIVSLTWRPLPSEVLLAAMALILGAAYFLQQQHIEQARFFRELFTEFNRRYDDLNHRLFGHLAQDAEKPFDVGQEQDFMDYFNLCAEEWLFYEVGYIYEPVWQAWRNGMRQFARDARVVRLWQEERKTESYYGFDFLGKAKIDA
jgi:hypothetical protein